MTDRLANGLRTRRLIVMRHASAVPNSEADSDHARPLTSTGRRDARRIAEQLASLGWVPDHVVTSDAARTVETWEGLAGGWTAASAIPVLTAPALYHAGPDAFRVVVGGLGSAVRTPLVLGHNPGWEQVVAWLTGTRVALGTANAVLLSGREDRSWAESLAPSAFEVHGIVRP